MRLFKNKNDRTLKIVSLTFAFISVFTFALFSQNTGLEKKIYDQLNYSNSIYLKNKEKALSILLALKPYALSSDSLSGLYYRVYANIKSNALQKDSALFYLDLSVSKFRKANNKRQTALSLNNTANIYAGKGDNELASQNYFKALKIAEAGNFKNEMAMLYKNIGVVFITQNKQEQALKYLNKSLKEFTDLSDTAGIGSVYLNTGNSYYNAYNDEQALIYYKKSLELANIKKDSINIGKLYNNIGAIYIDGLHDTLKGLEILQKSLQIKEANNEVNDLLFEYNEIATIYCYIKDFTKCKFYLAKAKDLALRSGNRTELAEVYRVYAIMYMAQGDHKQAYLNQTIYHQTKDSVLNIEKIKATGDIEAKYDLSKKDLEIAQNELKIKEQEKINAKKNSIIVFVLLAFTFFTILIIFYTRSKRLKIQKQNEERSALLMLESEQKERIRIARELHDGVGQKLTVLKMYASAFNNNDYNNMLDATINEVRSLSHKMIPEILNLGIIPALNDLAEKINATGQVKCEIINSINSDRKLEKETELSLYRITQEVLNNMLKHSKADKIIIKFTQYASFIELLIEDNGTGFDTKTIHDSKGMGWHNIFTRARLISAKVNIESNNMGTRAKLILQQ